MEGYSEQTGNTAPRVLIVDDNPDESNQIGLRSVRKMVEMHGGELYTFVETNVYTVCIAFNMINKYSGEGGVKQQE